MRLLLAVGAAALLAGVLGVALAAGVAREYAPSTRDWTGRCPGAIGADYTCQRTRLATAVRIAGAPAAFTSLRHDYGRVAGVKLICHALTHVMGRAALARYGSLAGAYAQGQYVCGAGYFHGVMEAAVQRYGLRTVLAHGSSLCRGLAGGHRHSAYQAGCAHGLGHGFMNMLGRDIFKSLRACDSLDERWEAQHCYNGVFMENMPDPDNRAHPSRYLSPRRPLYPCTAVARTYQRQCYLKQTSYALWTQGYAFPRVFRLCARVAGRFRSACYQGLGRNAFEQGVKGARGARAQVRAAGSLCASTQRVEASENCVWGAARYFVLFYGSDQQARRLCRTFSAAFAPRCTAATERFYRSSFPSGAPLGWRDPDFAVLRPR